MRGTVLYFGIGSLLLAAGVLAEPARAEDTGRPAARAAAAANVGRACRTEIPRFCAAGAGGAVTGRNAVICLRPYRTSLSLRCRGAVNEALRGAAPG